MGRFIPRRWVAAIALIGATFAGGAGEARAGFTRVNSHPPPREANQEQILEHVYGGNFKADGLNFSNGTLAATRIDDADDMTWTQQVGGVRPLANFAKRKQALGFFDDAAGTSNQLFSLTGSKFDVIGGVTTAATARLDGAIRTGRSENVAKAFSSLPSENRDQLDHLVSYRLSGPEIENPTYVLFWEDKWGRNSDFDFNDLVVEVTASSDPLMIPLPPAAWPGLAGLALIGIVGGCRRARRWIF
jgi:hypothetical protein